MTAEQTVEKQFPKPKMRMRPHQARLQEYQAILRGKSSPDVHGRQRGVFLKDVTNNVGISYRFDVVKSFSDNDIARYACGVEQVDVLLQKLQNDDFIHLDLGPNPICRLAFRGKHCMGTNYITKPSDNPIDTLSSEERDVAILKRDLLAAGYIPGKDFYEMPTHHTLYDLGGDDLTHAGEGIPHSITFQSLIVRAGALRDSRITARMS